VNLVPISDRLAALWTTALDTRIRYASWSIELADGAVSERGAETRYAGASMIKTWLLWLLVQDVMATKIPWEGSVSVTDDDVAGGDGLLRKLPLPTTLRVCDVAVLMTALSDNTAANSVIRLLGGPDTINQRLADDGYDARLRGWLSGRGNVAVAAPYVSTSGATLTPAGISVCSAAGFKELVTHARRVGGPAFDLFFSTLETQQDRRSLARYVHEDAIFPRKSGTIAGVRHDGGWLCPTDGDHIDISVFTDGEDRDEHQDDPACIGMGMAVAWTLRLVGLDNLLVDAAPKLPAVLFAPLSLLGAHGIESVLSSADVARSLPSEAAERTHWNDALGHEAPAAWSILADSRVVGMACLYADASSEPAVGIYLKDPRDRGQGTGTAVVELLKTAAVARGAHTLRWTASADNAASLALAARCGFTRMEKVVGFRMRAGHRIDEERWQLTL